MKISLGINQWFDGEGKPLSAGRISVYVHGSDVPKDIFTLDSHDTYTQASNPFILDDAGRSPTVWFDAATVDVKVEAYNGVPGSYDQVDTYQDGFDIPDAKNDTVAYGISGLKAINPEVGTVTVVGFSSSSDCGPRSFVWDSTCTASEDGCTIVSSGVDPDGRWILLSEERYMPSSWFGIVPGSEEANVAALLTYQETVGQWNIKMPPVPRFLPRTYTLSTGTFSTNKVVSFDPGAQFTKAKFTCPAVEISGNSSYVADFTFTVHQPEAHTSWFRTVEGFWHCDAESYVIDNANYFTDMQLKTQASLSRKRVTGTQPMAMTYYAGAYLQFSNCEISGKIFRQVDYVKFTTLHGDRNIISTGTFDPGLISAGHHTEYSLTPDLDDFESADRWLAVMVERKARMGALMTSTLDFRGRAVSNKVNTLGFDNVKNTVAANGFTVTSSVNFVNVTGPLYIDAAADAVTVTGSEVTIANGAVGPYYFGAVDSKVTVAGSIDPEDTQVVVNGGHWTGAIWLSDAHADAYKKHRLVSFSDVTFDQQVPWRVNNLSMRGCFGGAKVDMLPYASGSDYLYDISLIGNTFSGSTRFWFTMYGTNASPHTEIAGHAKFGAFIVTGNQWRGSDPFPLKMLRWHPFSFGQYLADSIGAWEYTDNVGNCPRVLPGTVTNASGVWSAGETGPDSFTFHMGTAPAYLFCPYFHFTDGSIDYMYGKDGIVAMGEWVAGFPAMGSSYNYFVLGGLKRGQANPPDYWDEDANNTFIVYYGVTIGAPAISDLTSGRLMWPEH